MEAQKDRAERHPKKSFLAMMFCLCHLGINIPKDIRQMLFDYIVIKYPLFRETRPGTSAREYFRPLLVYKREIVIPALTLKCDDIFAIKTVGVKMRLVLNFSNITLARFIERTENALSETLVPESLRWCTVNTSGKTEFKRSLHETPDGWSLVYEYHITNCAYHPEGRLDTAKLLRHNWCPSHDICLATFPGVLKRGELVDFPIVLTIDGLGVMDRGTKMLFRLEEKTVDI